MGENSVIILTALVFATFWIWALIDIFKSDFRESNARLLWGLFVFMLPLIGLLMYCLIGRKQKVKL